MSSSLRRLDWDSSFLGYAVGRLYGSQITQPALKQQLLAARAQGFRLLYWFVAPDDAESANSARTVGAFLADHKVRLHQPVSVAASVPILPAHVRTASISTPGLRALATQAGEYSRFRLDPAFATDVGSRLYTEWLRRSLTGELAREVLVYQSDAAAPPAGLLVLAEKNQRAAITLLAVAAAQRRQGIGRILLEAARQRTRAWGCTALQVVTQAANPAYRFYEREGFQLEYAEDVYHLWL